jgi:hypothetical protein
MRNCMSQINRRSANLRLHARLAFESLEQRLCMAATYDIDIVAQEDNLLTSLGRGPSINDRGQVAFQGSHSLNTIDGTFADNIYSFDPTTHSYVALMSDAYEQPNVGAAPVQTFSESVQINNLGQVLARRTLMALGSSIGEQVVVPLTYLEKWQAGSSPVQVAQASGSTTGVSLVTFSNPNYAAVSPTPIDYASPVRIVYGEASINNSGQVAFTALKDSGEDLFTGPHSTGTRYLGTAISSNVRPQTSIADTGAFVLSNATPGQLVAGSTIGVFPQYTFGVLERIASPTNGFTSVGAYPAISNDGRYVAFLGSLSDAGANTINAAQATIVSNSGGQLSLETVTPGAGIYVSFQSSVGRIIQKIAGQSGNGILDPGETFQDSNGNGALDPGEVDLGPIATYDPTSRVAIAAANAENGLHRLVFVGFNSNNQKGLFSAEILAPINTTTGVPIGGADPTSLSTVLLAGDVVRTAAFPEVHVQDIAINDPINASGQIVFWAATDVGEMILRAGPVLKPVLIFPGIGGVFPSDVRGYEDWIVNRGYDPELLQVDPLAHVYDNLIQSFITAGYRLNQNLFIANYDWRLPPGPSDGTVDGIISGITGSSITAADSTGEFQYGVDYLGYWLKKATDTWNTVHPDVPLESVDMIGHSTGGLVIRSYIQSTAYNDFYDGVHRLPIVDNFVMYNVPNRGAPKAWSFLQDDWWIDTGPTYPVIFREIIYNAFLKVLDGRTIRGRDYDITLAQLVPGSPEVQQAFVNHYNDYRQSRGLLSPPPNIAEVRRRFIQLFVPTIRSLLSTENFLLDGATLSNVNNDPNFRNDLLLDLNGGNDPNAFASAVGQVVNIWSNGPSQDGSNTIERQRLQNGSTSLSDRTQNFDDFFPDNPSGVWYSPVRGPSGDTTVPYSSLATPYLNDARINNFEFVLNAQYQTTLSTVRTRVTADDISHTAIVENRNAIEAILLSLGNNISFNALPAPSASPDIGRALLFLVDPVSAYVVDNQGRRTGYDASLGPLSEIPNSGYLGGAYGVGYVDASTTTNWRFVVTGDGGQYYVQVSDADGENVAGFALGGVLARGQKIETVIPPLRPVSSSAIIAEGESATTFENQLLKVPVLANDFSPSGFQLASITIVTPPSHGTVEVDQATGMISYRPQPGYRGMDQLSYTVRNSASAVSNIATLSIQVLQSPFMAGDFDGNDVVNGSDFLQWQRDLGSPNSRRSDGNGDGVTNLGDLLIWRANATGLPSGDYDENGLANGTDFLVWQRTLGSVSQLAADGNHNGIIDSGDLLTWKDSMQMQQLASLVLPAAASLAAESGKLGDNMDLAAQALAQLLTSRSPWPHRAAFDTARPTRTSREPSSRPSIDECLHRPQPSASIESSINARQAAFARYRASQANARYGHNFDSIIDDAIFDSERGSSVADRSIASWSN